MTSRLSREQGAALLVTLVAVLLLGGVAAVIGMITRTETLIAGNFRVSGEALYAAEAALDRTLIELAGIADWDRVLDGSEGSSLVDGPPRGRRRLPSGSTLDLVEATNLANCQKRGACSDDDLDAVTTERPWGTTNPRWRLFASAPLAAMLPPLAVEPPYYVVVFVSDDPSETDGDPLRDGRDDTNPGAGVLAVRAEAFGPRDARRVIEAIVARTDAAEVPLPPARRAARGSPAFQVSTGFRWARSQTSRFGARLHAVSRTGEQCEAVPDRPIYGSMAQALAIHGAVPFSPAVRGRPVISDRRALVHRLAVVHERAVSGHSGVRILWWRIVR